MTFQFFLPNTLIEGSRAHAYAVRGFSSRGQRVKIEKYCIET